LKEKLTLNLLTSTIVAPPSNARKRQMGFNSAFKGLRIFSDRSCVVSKDNFNVKKAKLNYRGEMGGKFPVDTSFIRDNAHVTAGVLRYMIKWTGVNSQWIQASYMIIASVTAALLKYAIKGHCICGVD
jgi:hypothetical protein